MFMTQILSECGLRGTAADDALRILRSLVRGFVLHEVMDSFFDTPSYDGCYESAIEMFIAGLPILARTNLKVANSEGGTGSMRLRGLVAEVRQASICYHRSCGWMRGSEAGTSLEAGRAESNGLRLRRRGPRGCKR
ncbi:hypothetical protein ACVWWO_007688 [Bradyrhizobium sp. F1.13.1]